MSTPEPSIATDATPGWAPPSPFNCCKAGTGREGKDGELRKGGGRGGHRCFHTPVYIKSARNNITAPISTLFSVKRLGVSV